MNQGVNDIISAIGREPRSQGPSLPDVSHAAARHVFDCWPEFVHSINSAIQVALFLDFDGTLAPLRRRPTDVQPLDAALRRVLRRLAQHQRLSVFVISGRKLSELRHLVTVPGIRLFGLHGWEGRDVPPMLEERQLLQEAKRMLDQRLHNTPEVWLEDKALGLSVHYRGAPQVSILQAHEIVRDVLSSAGPAIHVLQGHKVWELLPARINGKGPAVLRLLSAFPQPPLVIILGDDTSDETAFQALPKGLTIRVGAPSQTHARFLLCSPAEVRAFLLKLEAAFAGETTSSVNNIDRVELSEE